MAKYDWVASPICLKYYEISICLTHLMKTPKLLVKPMIFKLLSILLTSKLYMLWYHLSIHNERPTVSLIMLFCSSSLAFSSESFFHQLTNPQKNFSLTSYCDLNAFLKYSHCTLYTCLSQHYHSALDSLFIYSLVYMTGFVPIINSRSAEILFDWTLCPGTS